MKTVITLTRVYSKEIKIEVDPTLLEGKTDEEIADYLIEDYDIGDTDELFDAVEYEPVDFDEDSLDGVDTDRFDIYEGDKQINGGHL